MKKGNRWVTVADSSHHLFNGDWPGGPDACGKLVINVKAYVDPDGNAFLAERNIPGVPYGTKFDWISNHNANLSV